MIVEIIEKVRQKEQLTNEEITFFLNGYLDGTVKDYQMSAFLMAICCNGLTESEVFQFVECYLQSGKQLVFPQSDCLVDKHSTGGVGDKVTLVVAPIVASLGIPVIKMSGRGLGLTGGTIDKLESIPGYRVNLSMEEIRNQVEKIGIVVTSPTEDIVPLDKKTYALRDVTGTVSSIPLIAISIMSKKIAGGAKKFVFDMKYGEGAFLKTRQEAEQLAALMGKIALFYHCKVDFIYSDMSSPLGNAIGNRLEVLEAIDVLQGKVKGKLRKTCIEVASKMVALALKIPLEKAQEKVIKTLEDGSAYQKFTTWITTQGGDLTSLSIPCPKIPYVAKKSGKIQKIHARKIAFCAKQLGASRDSLEEQINYASGIYLCKQEQDEVQQGEVLAYLYTDKKELPQLDACFEIVQEK